MLKDCLLVLLVFGPAVAGCGTGGGGSGSGLVAPPPAPLPAILVTVTASDPAAAEPADPGEFAVSRTGIQHASSGVQFVIHVSVDGLRGDLLRSLMSADVSGDYDNFRRFVDEGATTFNARTDAAYTITLPNHTCMLTGRPVTQPAAQANTVHHGWTSNGDPGATQTLHNAGNPNLSYVASVFDVAHDNGLSTALFASKSKFVLFDRSYDGTNGAPDVTGVDDGQDKVDAYANLAAGSPPNASTLHAQYLSDMRASRFNYTFLCYRDADSAGHASGWGGASWQTAVRAVDGYLGELFALVETDPVSSPSLAGRTVILLTADHGGSGNDHSNGSHDLNYNVPFFVWGAGVESGADLYSLNPGVRFDPSAGHPDDDSLQPPIRNGESGNLALSLLGLPAIPGSTLNQTQSLRTTRGTISVNYGVSGSASSGGDFTPLSGVAYILPATSTVVIPLLPVNDGSPEGAEDVDLTLSPGAYTVGAPAAATITISDDD